MTSNLRVHSGEAVRRAAAALAVAATLLVTSAAEALDAGAAVTPIASPDGAPLGGWRERGAWNESEGVRDAADARALVLTGRTGAPRVGLVALDVFLVWPSLQAAIERASADLALDPVVVVATGTRSGPGGYADSLLASPWLGWHRDDAERAVVAAGADALRRAVAALEPARLGAGETRAPGLVRSADRDGGPVDDRVSIVRVDSAEGDAIATLFSYSAPPAVLSVANRSVSSDYPRHARRRIEAVHGGVAVFLPGALAGHVAARGGLERRRGDVVFETAVATEIGNALGLVIAAALHDIPVDDDGALAARVGEWSPPPLGPEPPCPYAGVARAALALPFVPGLAQRALGGAGGTAVPLVAVSAGTARLLFAPLAPSAGTAARVRERTGEPLFLVSNARAWLGELRAPGEMPSGSTTACLQLFGPRAVERFSDAASGLLGRLP
jgi:hypothetical protein